MTRPRSFLLSVAALALTLPAAASGSVATSYRYAYSTFREDAGRVSVFVDGYPASQRAKDAYVPIPFVVASLKGGKAIQLSPESFTLLDARGNAVPAAGYAELLDHYGKMSFDRTLIRQRPLVLGTYYGALLRIDGAFFPAPGARTRIERIEVPAYGYFEDVLYFPMPPAGLDGVLTLRVELPGSEPVEVRFAASKAGFERL
jgi:hypothetical protein